MNFIKKFGIGLSLAIVVLGFSSSLEARAHFGFGFGAAFEPRPSRAPCYVEEYYYPAETVIVHSQPRQHVYVESRPCIRRVYVQEQILVRPRPFFSFGFFR